MRLLHISDIYFKAPQCYLCDSYKGRRYIDMVLGDLDDLPPELMDRARLLRGIVEDHDR